MSSDIFSRPVDFKKFSLIYAGAQKNMGAAGVNLVVVKKDILGKDKRPIPTIMNYQKHIEAGSLMNTPPVFAVYVSMLTLRGYWRRWIGEMGKKAMPNQLFYITRSIASPYSKHVWPKKTAARQMLFSF
jgi:phosphoserine aminotransferase